MSVMNVYSVTLDGRFERELVAGTKRQAAKQYAEIFSLLIDEIKDESHFVTKSGDIIVSNKDADNHLRKVRITVIYSGFTNVVNDIYVHGVYDAPDNAGQIIDVYLTNDMYVDNISGQIFVIDSKRYFTHQLLSNNSGKYCGLYFHPIIDGYNNVIRCRHEVISG